MIESRLLLIAVVVAGAPACSPTNAAEKQVIFHDDFNRDNADGLGNQWSSRGAAVLQDKAALFQVKEEEFRPRIRHAFPLQDRGKFTVSFLMDWLRESEGTWALYMQLGNSAEIPRFLIYEKDLAKGMGVNLVWGGGELVDFQSAGSFGFLKNGKFNRLFVVNDAKVKETTVNRAVVAIDVDVDAGTYTVRFNGKTYPDLPFDNKGPIDTIRFITNGCSATGFSRSSIDDVMISKASEN